MSDFVPGLLAMDPAIGGPAKPLWDAPDPFAVRDMTPRGCAPRPRHFAPATPGHRATEGWDMFDPTQPADLHDKLLDEGEAVEAGDEDLTALTAARDAGFAEGLAAGREQAAQAIAGDEALSATLARLDQLINARAQIDRAQLADHLRRTVLMLVTRMVGEIGVDGDLLRARVDAAVDLLADSGDAMVLRVHPEDAALLSAPLPSGLTMQVDLDRARGQFALESASTLVEDGPELWLAQLAAAIDRAPLSLAR